MQGRRDIQREGVTPSRGSREGFPEVGTSSSNWRPPSLEIHPVPAPRLLYHPCPGNSHGPPLTDKETEAQGSLAQGHRVHRPPQPFSLSTAAPTHQDITPVVRSLRAGRDTGLFRWHSQVLRGCRLSCRAKAVKREGEGILGRARSVPSPPLPVASAVGTMAG